ncbi:MAG: SpoIIE family protein phosphatase [Limisphaerales bacterium]
MNESGFKCTPAASLRFEVMATFDAARAASVRVRKFLKDAGIEEEDLDAWELAIVESTNNVAEHGNTTEEDDKFQMDVHLDANFAEVRITDFTPGFDYPDTVELPDDLSEGGRGLFLIEQICDQVYYLKGRGANCLVLRKERADSGTKTFSAEDFKEDKEKEQLQQQIAELDEALDGMTEELSSSYESLAAIFKFSQELSKQRNLDEFAHMILDHLLKITESDWYLLRIKQGSDELVQFSASRDLSFEPLKISGSREGSLELQSAAARQDTWIDSDDGFQEDEPLAVFSDTKSAVVHPFYLNEDLVGTLSVGAIRDQKPLSAGQVNVLHTFSDFLALQILNARYQDEQIKSKVVSRELEIAANIQLSLLPKTLPELENFSLDGFYQSARHVGGDFYDAVATPDGGLLLTIADVMGKGVPAAMFSAILRTVLRSQRELAARPAELLQRASSLLFDDLDRVDMFITVQLVYIDPDGQFGACASAGHCPLLVGNPVTGDFQTIEADAPPIGILKDLEFADNRFELKPGSRLILYTDGVTEARNTNGDLWGDDAFEAWWKQASPQSAADLKEGLHNTVKGFVGDAAATDDLTFLVLANNQFQG